MSPDKAKNKNKKSEGVRLSNQWYEIVIGSQEYGGNYRHKE